MRFVSTIKDEFAFLRGNMLVLMASWLLMNFAGAIPSTYYSLYVLGLGGTPFIIGIIDFVSFLALALVQFPGGYLADKHGRRWLIVTFTFCIALSYVLFAIAPTWHFILLGSILANAFLIYQPALYALMADSIPAEKRGMGFSMFGFVNNAAAIFSPLVAGLLFIQHGLDSGMRIAYVTVVVFYLAAATLRIKLTETLQTNDRKVSLSSAVEEYPKAVREGFGVYRVLPRSMLFLFITNAFSSFIFAMSFPYLVVYATEALKIPSFTWAIVMMWFSGSMLLFALPSGKLVDVIGRKKPLVASWAFLALFPLFFLMGNLPMTFAAFLMFGISNALFLSAYQALEADLVPRELRGREVGCNQFVTYILMAIGGLAGGFFYQYVSPALPFMLAFIVTIPCLIVTVLLIHEPSRRQT